MDTLIEKGKIRARKGFFSQNDSDRESVNYKMCFLGIEDFQDILALQDLIAKNLPIAEIFRLHEEDCFRDFFCLERAAVGVITRRGLVAYSIIRIPGNGGDNLGRDIGLPQGELGKVAHLQATVVHPFFRGNGLQQKMAEAHLRVIEDLGILHVCCTVSPKNPVSLNNIFNSGFVIKGLRPMFLGWWRYIMYKNNLYKIKLDKSEASEEVNIMDSDIVGQVDLLKKGFVGFKMNRQPEGYRIYYTKP